MRDAHRPGVGVPRTGGRRGRGHVAARLADPSPSPSVRRVAVKARIVRLAKASPSSLAKHLRYITRDGVSRTGERPRAFSAADDTVDVEAFAERAREDRHHFRFIVAPEDGQEIGDLRAFTRTLLARMEADCGTRLDWIAADHWDTEHPHVHLVIRGRDQVGDDLVIAREYISHGMRRRAGELATEWLGPRRELDIRRAAEREVEQERWTSLDHALLQAERDGVVDVQALGGAGAPPRTLLLGRLQHLEKLGLAQARAPCSWQLDPQLRPTLQRLGERGDIVRTMQRAFSARQRPIATFDPTVTQSIVGRVVSKGLIDELTERAYVAVDAVDGRAYYVALPVGSDVDDIPAHGIIQVSARREHAADRNIARQAPDGVYRTSDHLRALRSVEHHGADPMLVVEEHVRRLEALRRGGIVERLADGVWKIPADFLERARRHDIRLFGPAVLETRSYISVEQQVRTVGATWLDDQLLSGSRMVGTRGFGSEVRTALVARQQFLLDHGWAERRGERVFVSHDLVAKLRDREIAALAHSIATKTGREYRPVVDGVRVSGTYRRAVQLASSKLVVLEHGNSFSLVPWRPVVETRREQVLSAVVRNGRVSWEFGRQLSR